MIEALDMLLRLSDYVEPIEQRKNKTWADATAAVGQGKAGMQFMGDWAKGELAARGYSVDKDFDCSLVPGTAYFMVIDAFAFPLTNRDGTAQAQQAFARMCAIGTTSLLHPDQGFFARSHRCRSIGTRSLRQTWIGDDQGA
ncbi:hypothetical protein K6M90_27275 [Rhizobium sp. 9T]|uniref:Uncharacterized protein n=1 Tax=Rhizobium croatiense TaxID=2867516 RepID=A0ABS7LT77_9HYPH|nr:hypothetical protein [Rhizobium croatiense]MBY4627938.1 hypothetical protein [Rhizobium croatiense]